MKPIKGHKPLFAVLTLGLSLVAALLLAEGVIRIFRLAPGLNRVTTDIHRLSNNPALGYELAPYRIHGYEAINKDGRRDFHYPKEKSKGVFRIAVLGDSVTYGWGTNVWQAHPNVTEYYLNRFKKMEERTFEVWNFGVRGYGTDEEVEALATQVVPTSPDLVVLAYNLNDPDPYSVDLACAYYEMNWADEQYFHEVRKAGQGGFRRFLYEKSRLFRFFRYRLLALRQDRERKEAINAEGRELMDLEKKTSYQSKKEKYFYEITQAYWPVVADSFARLASVCRREGIPAVIVIFPGLDDLVDYQYGPIHEQVRKEAEKNGLPVIDLAPDFLQAKKAWPEWEIAIDFDHPNGDGQRLAGWAIANHLIGLRLLPLEKEGFDESLFGFDLARKPMDLEYFQKQDMFHLEEGLNRMFFEETEGAVDSFSKALAVNPENSPARAMLGKLYQETGDIKIRQRIKGILH